MEQATADDDYVAAAAADDDDDDDDDDYNTFLTIGFFSNSGGRGGLVGPLVGNYPLPPLSGPEPEEGLGRHAGRVAKDP